MQNGAREQQGFLLDRATKLMMLKWLKDGYIDKMELLTLQSKICDSMTREEIEVELDRLASDYDCQRLKRLGICHYCS